MAGLVCKVELSKTGGITIVVDSDNGKKLQECHFDGEKITFKCKGSKGESTIVQEPDKVTVTCKEFVVDAETITCTSEKDSEYKSKQKMLIDSTKDMTLKSAAKLVQKAGKDLDASATGKATIKSNGKATISGSDVTIDAKNKAAVNGAQVAVAGKMKSELSGAQTKVAATAKLDLEGKLTTLSGQMTNVKGTLVKIG